MHCRWEDETMWERTARSLLFHFGQCWFKFLTCQWQQILVEDLSWETALTVRNGYMSFIHFRYLYSALQDFYSEALPITVRTLNRSFTPKRMSNCERGTCPGSLRGGLRWIRTRNPPAARHQIYPLEVDSNPQPSGCKAPNIPLHHRAPQLLVVSV